MRATTAEAALRRMYRALAPEMDERSRRQWAAVEAGAAGWGGVSLFARATGLTRPTLLAGLREAALLATARTAAAHCTRRPGDGRPVVTRTDPQLVGALLALTDRDARRSRVTVAVDV